MLVYLTQNVPTAPLPNPVKGTRNHVPGAFPVQFAVLHRPNLPFPQMLLRICPPHQWREKLSHTDSNHKLQGNRVNVKYGGFGVTLSS